MNSQLWSLSARACTSLAVSWPCARCQAAAAWNNAHPVTLTLDIIISVWHWPVINLFFLSVKVTHWDSEAHAGFMHTHMRKFRLYSSLGSQNIFYHHFFWTLLCLLIHVTNWFISCYGCYEIVMVSNFCPLVINSRSKKIKMSGQV